MKACIHTGAAAGPALVWLFQSTAVPQMPQGNASQAAYKECSWRGMAGISICADLSEN